MGDYNLTALSNSSESLVWSCRSLLGAKMPVLSFLLRLVPPPSSGWSSLLISSLRSCPDCAFSPSPTPSSRLTWLLFLSLPGSPSAAPGSSFMPDVFESEWLKLPADISASGFYITNANNYFVGNTAVGGWSAYAFPNLPKPIGLSRNVNMSPFTRPSWVFDGNSARSSAFLWGSSGCIYFGGWLVYDTTDPNRLIYNPGRYSRPDPSDGKPNLLTNTKMALCNNLALMHWCVLTMFTKRHPGPSRVVRPGSGSGVGCSPSRFRYSGCQ